MEEIWRENERRAAWRRRRQVTALAGVAVAVGVIWAVFGASRGDETLQTTGPTPGYRADGRSSDTSPFELARPDKVRSSTIPNGVLTDPTDDGSGDGSTPQSTPVPTAPTTTEPVVPQAPTEADSITSLCGFTESIESMGTLITNRSGVNPETAARTLRAALAGYQRYVPDELNASFQTVQGRALEALDVLAAGGYSVDDPAFQALVTPLFNQSAEAQDLLTALGRISSYESRTCPKG